MLLLLTSIFHSFIKCTSCCRTWKRKDTAISFHGLGMVKLSRFTTHHSLSLRSNANTLASLEWLRLSDRWVWNSLQDDHFVSDVDLILVGTTTYPSYLQLYGYGFTKIEDRSNMYFGAYVHPDFHRDHPTQACTIQRRSSLGTRDRRFKKNTNTAVEGHRTRPCGTQQANVYRNDSLSSLEIWISTGDAKPEVSLDSDWKTVRPRTSPFVDHTSESLLPSHVNHSDDWLADLQMVFCSSPCSHHNSASCSNGILSFEEFKSLFEPRPIECMIKKWDYFQR